MSYSKCDRNELEKNTAQLAHGCDSMTTARKNRDGILGCHKKNPKTTYALGGTKFVASLRFLSRAATFRGMGPPGPT